MCSLELLPFRSDPLLCCNILSLVSLNACTNDGTHHYPCDSEYTVYTHCDGAAHPVTIGTGISAIIKSNRAWSHTIDIHITS